MYRCANCHELFDEPDENYFELTRIDGQRIIAKDYNCPFCKSDAIAVYAALLKMNDAIDDASGDQKIRGASYVVYALLGGEARSYNFSPNCDDSN